MSNDLQEFAAQHNIGGIRTLMETFLSKFNRLISFTFHRRENVLSFTMEPQLYSQWCWAATSKSISAFYNFASTWTQCSVAEGAFSQNCCIYPAPCNRQWHLHLALGITGNLVVMLPQRLDFPDIERELQNRRLIGARIGWMGGGGHFMVIHGCYSLNGAQYLNIDDPIYGKSELTWDSFCNRYQGVGTWTHTYKTKP